MAMEANMSCCDPVLTPTPNPTCMLPGERKVEPNQQGLEQFKLWCSHVLQTSTLHICPHSEHKTLPQSEAKLLVCRVKSLVLPDCWTKLIIEVNNVFSWIKIAANFNVSDYNLYFWHSKNVGKNGWLCSDWEYL